MTTKDMGLKDSLAQDISAVLESFSEKDPSGKQSLSELLASDPRNFTAAAIRVLAKCEPSPGSRYLVHLLTKEKMLPAGLLDTNSTDVAGAVAAVRAVAEAGTNLQPMLELALQRALLDQPSNQSRARILRLLEVLAAIAVPSCWNAFQLELMAYPDQIVRSKAALLIGRSARNVAWIGRRFLDRDARVQASAVEALWGVEASDARPLLNTAAKSKNNRVAANAVLGLYRISDSKAVSLLLDMVRHEEAAFRLSALWAIGETQDPRFLPFLLERFKASEGRERLAITKMMARVRRREKAHAEAGTLRFRVAQARAGQDGQRQLGFSLWSESARDLSSLKPVEFAVWEGGELILDYEMKSPGTPVVLATGFVAPQFLSAIDPYALAVTAALNRCNSSKRPDDLWRIDRWSIEASQAAAEAPRAQSFLPYDDAIATQEVKMRHCFIADADILSKIISSDVPRDRAASDASQAIQRQCEAIGKLAGKRHVFVFLHQSFVAAFEEPDHMSALKQVVTNEKIALHGFAADPSHDCPAFRSLCQSTPGGSFTDTIPEQLPDAVNEIYSPLINGFEITYRLPAGVEPGPVILKVSSNLGAGQADITLKSDAGD